MMTGKEIKIFDPADGFAPFTNPIELTDSTIAKRGNRWWMYLAGEVQGHEGIQLFSASLPEGAPLASQGWELTADRRDPTHVALLAGHESSKAWDLKGGRHCPAYVRGWDAGRKTWVERIYYAGGAANLWGPYTIGYLEWDGNQWVDQPGPVFVANEDWEHGAVCTNPISSTPMASGRCGMSPVRTWKITWCRDLQKATMAARIGANTRHSFLPRRRFLTFV